MRDVLLLHGLLHVRHVRLEGGVDAHVAVAPLLAERLPVLLARPPRLLGVLEADKRLSERMGVGLCLYVGESASYRRGKAGARRRSLDRRRGGWMDGWLMTNPLAGDTHGPAVRPSSRRQQAILNIA